MSIEELKALKTLKNNDSITIFPADKSNTTIVIDTDEYDRKINYHHLSNNNMYSIVNGDIKTN